ncbi:tetratricopeptide repeat-containing sulfotransferase family protein [Erythrobacter sp. HL-111]|uniref:tetratricopeptide repeat-containing sulfotransferase family protein n=1 Tax=Erythrobacter sp. HL-111 TaxID=1798193 RepID=UPI0006DA36A1|nr:tetratricopeptide repeat-containing sulfotransferase family protein [Erythrobacter sp. HL-111]KPP93847.1 MAG: Sulfotransferase family/Tetratricopeptide repeat [Erythrobacteraceae bacterium HL-111]SDS37684.1 Tetratricopeptide repeat-containing protein [Erythrobacter sp. HL-111]
MTAEATTRAAELKQAQAALQQGRFAEGLAMARALVQDDPGDGEALYLAAVAARYLKDYEAAEDWLSKLHRAMPEYGRAWQEAGHLALARGREAEALAAFVRATRFNPALEASWREQARLLAAAGRAAEAAMARRQQERLARLPRELVAVTNHLAEGRLLRAEEICRHYLRTHPRKDANHIEGMRLLAKVGIEFGVLEEAEFLLESAVAFAPDDVQLRLDYIDALRRRQNFAKAHEEAEKLYARDPASPVFRSRLAIESMAVGDYERGLELFDAVLQQHPRDPANLTSKGHALKTTGAREAAIAAYRAAIAAKPDHGDAWYALANLKTYRFGEDELAAMKEQAARPDLSFMDRVHIAFALGKAHEDREEYAASFAAYDEGNALKRAQTRYSADAMSAELARQKAVCTRDLFEARAGSGHDAPDPIFILGLPRAGSTLLEQILASHSQIDGTLELPDILALAHRLRGRRVGENRYPDVLRELTADQLAKFGRDFIENTRIHRAGAPFFIDKMPNNFRHIGLIHLILPNAKIIDARRDPMDCCFSGFKQLFAEGQEFTYGLREMGRYYADYVALMDHWDEVLPGKVLRVRHEDVLDDLEGQTRRMLDHVGLPFEEACLDFHRTSRAVRTASSEQVRQPLNRKGQGAWKPFEPWLGELKEALGDLAPREI